MADDWPWPVDNAIDRARVIAQEYRRHLLDAAPDVCAQLDQLMNRFGERWITGTATSGDDILTTEEAAILLSITPRGVRLAVQRGRLRAEAQDGEGYLFRRDVVLQYLTTGRRRSVGIA